MLSVRVDTALSLGPTNIARVLWHRMRRKCGYYRWRLPVSVAINGPLFVACRKSAVIARSANALLDQADTLLNGKSPMFGSDPMEVGEPPHWHADPFSGRRMPRVDRHWSRYSDFSSDIDDIKTLWELSRFSWSLVLVRAYRVSGDNKYLEILNRWAADWLEYNPYNRGPNWMCGQEASIRLAHVLLADALLRDGSACTRVLHEFVVRHCERIRETISYALAQDNNHGTSEAFGLLLGGMWLVRNARDAAVRRRGAVWYRTGRRRLERQIRHLVLEDGTFSQMSMTYQRLFVDTVAMAEWWRGRFGMNKFSDAFYDRARLATRWLYNFVDSDSGDVANIGAHDGSALFPLCSVGHRDCRPTVQLAGALFLHKRCIAEDGPWNETLAWLEVETPSVTEQAKQSQVYPEGGFTLLRAPGATSYVVARFPSSRFRPGQADALHVDLWSGGTNVLRDGGTFSYASDEWGVDYFSGTQSHNTCQFDGRDQMPRLSRFLYGAWLKTQALCFESEGDRVRWSAAYTDYRGCWHERTISWNAESWVIVDEFSGHRNNAVLRWRLCPDVAWSKLDRGIESALASLSYSSESEFKRIELCSGWESRFYMRRTPLPVLEIELGPGCHRVTTEIRLYPTAL